MDDEKIPPDIPPALPHIPGRRLKRRRRPFVHATGQNYAQWTVIALAAILVGFYAWQYLRPYVRPDTSQNAPSRAASSTPTALPPGSVAWQRDVMASLDQATAFSQSGNITAAEVSADRTAAILTAARVQSQAAAPDFFIAADTNLDRVLQPHSDDPRLLEHVTDARIELAELRSWQNPVPENSAQPVTAHALPGHVALASPRELVANETLNAKTLGGKYLDGALMPASPEILLPPASRVLTDNVRVENLTISGAAQTLDGIHWQNVTFIGTRVRYEGGSIDLKNVHFVHCTFGVSNDARGSQFTSAIALGRTTLAIE